jgi:hypothetical protein
MPNHESRSVPGDVPDPAVADSANQAVKRTADSFLDAVGDTIESQPYTAVIIAFGLGWLWKDAPTILRARRPRPYAPHFAGRYSPKLPN